MTAAVLCAAAVWWAMQPSAHSRLRQMASLSQRSGRASAVDTRVAAAICAGVSAVLILGLVPGVLATAVLAPLVVQAVGRLESGSARRLRERRLQQVPLALELLVAALEAGQPVSDALDLVAGATGEPLGDQLATVAARLRVSLDPREVFRSLEADPALGQMALALGRAYTSGMAVAAVVEHVAADMRRRSSAERRANSQKIAVRTAAPLGACFLPAFFLVAIVPSLVSALPSL